MRVFGRGWIILLAVVVAGCARSPTPYQAMDNSGGYSELKLNADTYRITVRANAYTSEERAHNIAMLRASELTLQAGFDRFDVVGGRGVREKHVGTYDGTRMFRPRGEIVIRMVAKGDPDYAEANDARLIAEQLRAKLR